MHSYTKYYNFIWNYYSCPTHYTAELGSSLVVVVVPQIGVSFSSFCCCYCWTNYDRETPTPIPLWLSPMASNTAGAVQYGLKMIFYKFSS